MEQINMGAQTLLLLAIVVSNCQLTKKEISSHHEQHDEKWHKVNKFRTELLDWENSRKIDHIDLASTKMDQKMSERALITFLSKTKNNKFPDMATHILGPNSAHYLLHQDMSHFYMEFPLSILAEWDLIFSVIHQEQHWLLYIISNKNNRESAIIDTLHQTPTVEISQLKQKLDRAFLLLLSINDEDSSEQEWVTNNQRILPTYAIQDEQSNDCAILICDYAEHIMTAVNNGQSIFADSTIAAPDINKRRTEIYETIYSQLETNINNNNNSEEPHNRIGSTHPKLIGLINSLHNAHTPFDPSRIINHLISIVEELKPDKSILPPTYIAMKQSTPSQIQEMDEHVRNLRKEYDLNPSKVINNILHSKTSQFHPSPSDIVNHFRTKETPSHINIHDAPSDWSLITSSSADNISYLPITKEEILKALKNSGNTSPGSDGIHFLDLKKLDPEGVLLEIFFNKILSSGIIPEQWRKIKTLLIPKNGKKDEQLLDVSAWRPIAILDSTYRLFTKILNNRLLLWIESGNLIPANQKAILHVEGCNEHNFLLRSAQEIVARLKDKKQGELHIAFLDLADAFGSVPHELLWSTLEKYGLNTRTIQLFKNLYKDTSSTYICNNCTEQIAINRGVKQGCPLSMTLVCLSINHVISYNHPEEFTSIGPYSFPPILAYADDIAVITTSRIAMQALINRINNKATWAQLQFRPNKCAYYFVSNLRRSSSSNSDIYINNTPIPRWSEEEKIKYLGIRFSEEKGGNHEIHEKLRKNVKDTDLILGSSLSPGQKIRAYQTFIVKARLNILQLKYNNVKNRMRNQNLRCRRCGYAVESQAHVFCHCPYQELNRMARHNHIQNALCELLLQKEFQLEIDKKVDGIQGNLRPDIVATDRNRKFIYVIDVKSPYDEVENMASARRRNEEKYEALKEEMKKKRGIPVFLDTFVVGALGSWDPANEVLLSKLRCTKAEIKKLAHTTVLQAISSSYSIYQMHQ